MLQLLGSGEMSGVLGQNSYFMAVIFIVCKIVDVSSDSPMNGMGNEASVGHTTSCTKTSVRNGRSVKATYKASGSHLSSPNPQTLPEWRSAGHDDVSNAPQSAAFTDLDRCLHRQGQESTLSNISKVGPVFVEAEAICLQNETRSDTKRSMKSDSWYHK